MSEGVLELSKTSNQTVLDNREMDIEPPEQERLSGTLKDQEGLDRFPHDIKKDLRKKKTKKSQMKENVLPNLLPSAKMAEKGTKVGEKSDRRTVDSIPQKERMLTDNPFKIQFSREKEGAKVSKKGTRPEWETRLLELWWDQKRRGCLPEFTPKAKRSANRPTFMIAMELAERMTGNSDGKRKE